MKYWSPTNSSNVRVKSNLEHTPDIWWTDPLGDGNLTSEDLGEGLGLTKKVPIFVGKESKRFIDSGAFEHHFLSYEGNLTSKISNVRGLQFDLYMTCFRWYIVPSAFVRFTFTCELLRWDSLILQREMFKTSASQFNLIKSFHHFKSHIRLSGF